MANPYERIVWSADVKSIDELLRYLESMPKLQWIKIDRLFFTKFWWPIFAILRERGLKIFDDEKLIEVPHKLEELALTHCEMGGATMLNCMAGAISNGNFRLGSDDLDGLLRFSNVCHKFDVIPCAVTVLTSKTEEVVFNEFNDRSPVEQVMWYARQLVKAGFSAMVCSPREAEFIREDAMFDSLTLFTPGVRPSGTPAGSQKRFTTPAEAIRNGSNYLVIGGPITDAPDPAEALDAIAAEIQSYV